MRYESVPEPLLASTSHALSAAPSLSPVLRLASSSSDMLLGGRYRIEQLVGSGAMGKVYRATDLKRGVSRGVACAIKMLNAPADCGEEEYRRFANEASIVAKLRHPNIVEVGDFLFDGSGRPFLVMELLEGADLHTHLQAASRLPLARVQQIVLQVASALHYSHQMGIIHRDIKPRNIFLCQPPLGSRNAADVVKVVDFGLSKMLGSSTQQTAQGIILGTPEYMSPEATFGQSKEVDARTDQWALAVTAYRMLSGTLPFAHDDVIELLLQIRQQPPRPIAELVPELPEYAAEAIARAMSKRKQDRFATMQEFAQALCPSSASIEQRNECANRTPGAPKAVQKRGNSGPFGVKNTEQTRKIERILLDDLIARSGGGSGERSATVVYEAQDLQDLGIALVSASAPSKLTTPGGPTPLLRRPAVRLHWNRSIKLGLAVLLLALTWAALPRNMTSRMKVGHAAYRPIGSHFQKPARANVEPSSVSTLKTPTVSVPSGPALPAAQTLPEKSNAVPAPPAPAAATSTSPRAAHLRAVRSRVLGPSAVEDKRAASSPALAAASPASGVAAPESSPVAEPPLEQSALTAASLPALTVLPSPVTGIGSAASPRTLMPSATPAPVTLRRISGADPHLPGFLRSQLRGEVVVCTYFVCIEPSGRVGLVKPLRGLPNSDDQIVATLLTWRYLPIASRTCHQQEFRFEVTL